MGRCGPGCSGGVGGSAPRPPRPRRPAAGRPLVALGAQARLLHESFAVHGAAAGGAGAAAAAAAAVVALLVPLQAAAGSGPRRSSRSRGSSRRRSPCRSPRSSWSRRPGSGSRSRCSGCRPSPPAARRGRRRCTAAAPTATSRNASASRPCRRALAIGSVASPAQSLLSCTCGWVTESLQPAGFGSRATTEKQWAPASGPSRAKCSSTENGPSSTSISVIGSVRTARTFCLARTSTASNSRPSWRSSSSTSRSGGGAGASAGVAFGTAGPAPRSAASAAAWTRTAWPDQLRPQVWRRRRASRGRGPCGTSATPAPSACWRAWSCSANCASTSGGGLRAGAEPPHRQARRPQQRVAVYGLMAITS